MSAWWALQDAIGRYEVHAHSNDREERGALLDLQAAVTARLGEIDDSDDEGDPQT